MDKTNGDIEILGKKKVDLAGVEEGGEGRVVRLKQPIMIEELEDRIKRHLKLSHSESYILTSSAVNSPKSICAVQVGYPNPPSKLIQTVAICAGSGGSMLLGYDADVYFTGEMSHVGSLPLSVR